VVARSSAPSSLARGRTPVNGRDGSSSTDSPGFVPERLRSAGHDHPRPGRARESTRHWVADRRRRRGAPRCRGQRHGRPRSRGSRPRRRFRSACPGQIGGGALYARSLPPGGSSCGWAACAAKRMSREPRTTRNCADYDIADPKWESAGTAAAKITEARELISRMAAAAQDPNRVRSASNTIRAWKRKNA
jgi:hypothetical protein